MLLICAVQAVSFVWTAIFRHRARRGNLRRRAHSSRAPRTPTPHSLNNDVARRTRCHGVHHGRRHEDGRLAGRPHQEGASASDASPFPESSSSSRGPVLSRRAFRSDRILTYVRLPPRLSFAALQGKKEQRAAKKKALVRSRRVPCLRVARFDRVARRVRPRARENSVHSFNSSGERIIPRCYAFDRTIP